MSFEHLLQLRGNATSIPCLGQSVDESGGVAVTLTQRSLLVIASLRSCPSYKGREQPSLWSPEESLGSVGTRIRGQDTIILPLISEIACPSDSRTGALLSSIRFIGYKIIYFSISCTYKNAQNANISVWMGKIP